METMSLKQLNKFYRVDKVDIQEKNE
jgi:hypothetical protein